MPAPLLVDEVVAVSSAGSGGAGVTVGDGNGETRPAPPTLVSAGIGVDVPTIAAVAATVGDAATAGEADGAVVIVCAALPDGSATYAAAASTATKIG